jgi:hypothetical protein
MRRALELTEQRRPALRRDVAISRSEVDATIDATFRDVAAALSLAVDTRLQ